MREATGLTLSQVARDLGWNKGRLSVIERGLIPTDAERAALNAYLGAKLAVPENVA
jgi:transcriptional regulator with XRE-family HTH domain